MRLGLLIALLAIQPTLAWGDDWPEWGGGSERNMASSEKNIASDFDPGRVDNRTGEVLPATTRGVRWTARLGSQTYGNPTVAKGRVLVGTNNAAGRLSDVTGDYSLVQSFDEKTGAFQWQFSVPKLGAGKVNDWEFLGICSSPAIRGNQVHLVTNRCEVVALDLQGMANGNDGYQGEATYVPGPKRPPRPIGAKDADILWRFDMRDGLGVFPHNVASSSVLLVGDRLYATTSNGTDWSHLNIPAPFSPSLVALNRKTGALLAEEATGISERTLHSNWSSPGFVPPSKKRRSGIVLFGAGDGFLYGFSPKPSTDKTGLSVLKELWRFDANAPGYRTRNGKPIKYATGPGPSEIIGTPVHHKGTVYVSIGQDPEHGSGVGRLSALNPHAGTGDITEKGRLWTYDGIHRSISTVAVGGGLVYAADYDGVLHCLDARTGKLQWTHDTMAHIWGSPLLVDGKIYLGNEDGVLTLLKAGRERKVIRTIDFPAPIHSSPVVSGGVLYIATQTHLYAIDGSR